MDIILERKRGMQKYGKNMLQSMYNIEIDKEFEIFKKAAVSNYTTVVSAAIFVF